MNDIARLRMTGILRSLEWAGKEQKLYATNYLIETSGYLINMTKYTLELLTRTLKNSEYKLLISQDRINQLKFRT